MWSFTRNKEKIKHFKKTGDSAYIYQNKLDKYCFQNDTTYRDFKNLNQRTAANKVLLEKKHKILLKIQNTMDLNVHLFQQFIIFLIKKASGGAIKKEIMKNEELANKLQKPTIRKFEKNKVRNEYLIGTYI